MSFGVATYGVALLAGGLTVLAPCVLPLLPIIVGAALAAHRLGPLALAGGLALSFTAIGLFVATVGFAIGLDGDWFRNVGAVILIALGLVLLSARLQQRFAVATSSLSTAGDSIIARVRLSGLPGQFAIGLLLGIIWTPCVGPTLGATATLAAQGQDLIRVALIMMLFGLGAALPLILLGSASRAAFGRVRGRLLTAGIFGKSVLGAVMLILGVMILSDLDKRLEAILVEHSPAWMIDITTHF